MTCGDMDLRGRVDLRGRIFCIRPFVHASDGTCGDGPFVSVPLFMPAEKQGDRHKRTVPMSPPPHVPMSPTMDPLF